jgi:hypothetical protein
MTMEKNLKRTLRPFEVHDMFGIPEGTLANMRWAKRGPRYFKKPGGRGIFYLLSDVQEWITREPILTTDSMEATK